MPIFTLYTTEGCHLCEQAIGVIHALAMKGIQLEVFLEDIAESESLVAEYGVRIPVLKHDATGHEMSWPFSPDGLETWIDKIDTSS